MLEYISKFRSDNIFAIAELFYHGVSVDKIYELTQITPYFLEAIKRIVDMEEILKLHVNDAEYLLDAKKMGFSDKYIARMWKQTELDVFNFRKAHNIFPVFRMVDTCHTGAYIPYFYSSYTGENDSRLTTKKKIVVLGANGEILAQNDGEYGNQKFLYQEYTELPQDAKGQKYQAGVFFAFEGCALGFRKGGEIIDNYSKFVGHIIV